MLFEPDVPFEVALVRVDVEEIEDVEFVAIENVDCPGPDIGKGKSNKFDSKSLKSSCEDILL